MFLKKINLQSEIKYPVSNNKLFPRNKTNFGAVAILICKSIILRVDNVNRVIESVPVKLNHNYVTLAVSRLHNLTISRNELSHTSTNINKGISLNGKAAPCGDLNKLRDWIDHP